MKRYKFDKRDYDKVDVICKSDGDVGYCNALAVNGLCKCDDCICRNAVAVIATKNGCTRYYALTDD